MTLELTLRLVGLFAVLFIIGTVACLPLYRFDIQRFLGSMLWEKILWWIPIFTVFLLILHTGLVTAVVVTGLLLLQSLREFNRNQGLRNTFARVYYVVFVVALLHLGLFLYGTPADSAIKSLIVVAFTSVLSDVGAFFTGKYAPRTPLPEIINSQKSWEGVGGQIIGALGGYGMLWLFLDYHGFWIIALGIGFASAVGDLLNSAAKRSLKIKDWGNTIPGHGGILDRFASLSLAIALVYWMIR